MTEDMTPQQAKDLMMAWAMGKRSYTNLASPACSPDVVAVMDAQEVVKWAEVYRTLLYEERQGK